MTAYQLVGGPHDGETVDLLADLPQVRFPKGRVMGRGHWGVEIEARVDTYLRDRTVTADGHWTTFYRHDSLSFEEACKMVWRRTQ